MVPSGEGLWEYTVVEVHPRTAELTDWCNELGAMGWELAGMAPKSADRGLLHQWSISGLILVFKRPSRAAATRADEEDVVPVAMAAPPL